MNIVTPFHNNLTWPVFFRVGTACVLLASMLSLWPDYTFLYGAEGMADRELFQLQQPSLFRYLPVVHGGVWQPLVYMALCLLLACGIFTRGIAVALLLFHGYLFTGTYAAFSYGIDYIASSCLFYCAMLPPRPSQRSASSLHYLRFLQIYVCIIYFFAGLGKVMGPTWHNGEALWKAVSQPGFESVFKPDLLFLGSYPLLWTMGGWVVVILELGYSLFIWFKGTRAYWLAAMLALHTGIALFMGLYSFSALMVVLNLAAFYMPYRPVANFKQSNKRSIHSFPDATRSSETPIGVPPPETASTTDV
ncbi:hypothetical protein [Parapedobacter soli]|uniref:hypothetical protein n=1 Tax=Parapedobacter soli TaxID=416955 RepID=UPI0021C7BC81|nr:hypothetical protein [Parapedobacter soli]